MFSFFAITHGRFAHQKPSTGKCPIPPSDPIRSHSKDSGEVYSTGDNVHGQLGLGDNQATLQPRRVRFLGCPGVRDITSMVTGKLENEDNSRFPKMGFPSVIHFNRSFSTTAYYSTLLSCAELQEFASKRTFYLELHDIAETFDAFGCPGKSFKAVQLSR